MTDRPRKPILTVRKTVTVKPEFIDYLDSVVNGETIRIVKKDDLLKFLSEAHRYPGVTFMDEADEIDFIMNGKGMVVGDDEQA